MTSYADAGTGQHHFRLTIGGGEPIAFFKEATGFDSESEITEVREADASGQTVVRRVPGPRKAGLVTLGRGVDANTGLWEWRRAMETEGADAARQDCTLELLDQDGTTIATFSLRGAWPKSYVAAELSSGFANEIATEKITLAHEGFVREG